MHRSFSYVIYKDIVSRMADLNGERGILSYILSGVSIDYSTK